MATQNADNFGTMLQVSQGGTGKSNNAQVYGVECGGSTSTSFLRNITNGISTWLLRSNDASTLPSFQSSSLGNLVLLQSQAVSGVTNVQFKGVISSTYSTYLLIVSNGVVTATGSITGRVSTNNGSTYISTGYTAGTLHNSWNSASLVNGTTATSINLGNVNSTDNMFSGKMWMFNATNGNNFASLSYFFCTPTTTLEPYRGIGTLATANINAFQLSASAGTMSGTFSLFGLLE